MMNSVRAKFITGQGMIGLREIGNLPGEILTKSKNHWVYDMEHDVLCVVDLGDHIGAVRFIVRNFYGLNRIYREEIPKWQEIIGNNMIFYNAKVNDSKHYASSLPRKYKQVD